MAETTYFHFKAATGFGAVIDGSVPADSADQVSRMLVRQGLIPVRIWSNAHLEQKSKTPLIRMLNKYLLGRWRAAH